MKTVIAVLPARLMSAFTQCRGRSDRLRSINAKPCPNAPWHQMQLRTAALSPATCEHALHGIDVQRWAVMDAGSVVKLMPKAQRHRAEYVRWQRCESKLGHEIPPA